MSEQHECHDLNCHHTAPHACHMRSCKRDKLQTLLDENARLARVNGVAVIALRYYSKTAISARAVDALEKIAALDGGKGVQGVHD